MAQPDLDAVYAGGASQTSRAPRRTRGPLRMAGQALVGLWLFAVLVGLWWLLTEHSTSPYFPPLSQIVSELWKVWVFHGIRVDLVPSLVHLVVGYALAGILGIAVGVLFWRVRVAKQSLSPIVYFLYVLPAPVLLPAFIVLFGIGSTMKIAIIAFASIWPVLFNTIDGMEGVDSVKLDTARSLGLSRGETLRSVVLPGASPQIAAGLRNSLQVAILLMVVSEMVASTSGIGYFILNAQQSFESVDMWTGIIVLGVVGSALNLIFVTVERGVLRWYYGERALQTV
ncbi:MAG TPA: ABC transporter permease [Solirubrobacteraceae bacterium]|nr:ABC transporter permease [Solirubrobacteraceae bacterium]